MKGAIVFLKRLIAGAREVRAQEDDVTKVNTSWIKSIAEKVAGIY